MKFITATHLLTVAALLVAASTSALAADPREQRLALAHTKTTDASHKAATQPAPHHVAKAEHTTVAITHTQRPQSRAERDNDGSRFRYDTCGCSND
jgi:hypothetical protein